MSPVTRIYRVDQNGNVVVPVGVDRAGSDVEVTVQPVTGRPTPANGMSDEQWEEFVARTAGSIDDATFERPPQGEYERRSEL
jgi:hypothetical protein